jgi:murein DD-endopeptidase MepM/ murein hydrolase activator NlpD
VFELKFRQIALVTGALLIGLGSALGLKWWLPHQGQAAALPVSCQISTYNGWLNNGISTLIWPISGNTTPDTALISSPFGPRWQASQSRNDYHSGIDIASPLDTPVHVITDGVVSKVGWLSADSGLSIIPVWIYPPLICI